MMILSRYHNVLTEDCPTLLRDNFIHREKIISLCTEDDEIAKDICLLFRSDPIWAVNTFFWTFDPRNQSGKNKDLPKDMPFILYNFQQEGFGKLIRNMIINPQDCLIEKSRDMGLTWLVLAAILYNWITVPSFQALVGSRKEDLVDNWMVDSHFGKLRYMYSRLPHFLKSPEFKQKIHDTKMNLFNPANGSSIQGEATSPNFGRGGRYNVALLDEFASWENDKEAWLACGDSTPCRIALSTPEGMMNQYGILRFSGNIEVLSYHWTSHPDKSSGYYYDEKDKKAKSHWYNMECKRRNFDKLAIAQELDIDYVASGRPVFDTKFASEKIRQLRENPQDELVKGDLYWVEGHHPLYNEHGVCINKKDLRAEFNPTEDGYLILRCNPEEPFKHRFRYVIAADTAEGLEQGDYDVARVMDRNGNRKKIIAHLRGHWTPHQYAVELAKLGAFFGLCPIWPEKNNHGHAVIQKLWELYPNIGHEKYQDKGMMNSFSEKLGWYTGEVSKPIMIDCLDKLIREGAWDDPYVAFWEETMVFVKDAHGRMSAQNKGKGGKFYDDIIMASAILTQADRYLPLMDSEVVKTPEEKLEEEFAADKHRFMQMLRTQVVNSEMYEESDI